MLRQSQWTVAMTSGTPWVRPDFVVETPGAALMPGVGSGPVGGQYADAGGTATVTMLFREAGQVTPIADLAEALALEGAREIESVVAIHRAEYLEIWVIVDDADREARRCIHDIEWAIMCKYADSDIRFELLRRRGRPLASVVTFPVGSTTIDLREMDAYFTRASLPSRPQQGIPQVYYRPIL